MRTCGIIAEYNPFHNGHMYQIAEARKKSGCECVVAVMSGNFVQRGEPAVTDKWKRAECAVRNGVDVVIELPYVYAVQAASGFAHGGVALLKKADVDYISFGSECGNEENLREIADTPVNPDHLREAMSEGMSYPKAYSLLTAEMEPNDILAVCYLKEIRGSRIRPIVIPRNSGYLDKQLSQNASALAIREALKKGKNITGTTPIAEILKDSECVYPEQYYLYFRTFVEMSSSADLSQLFLFNEGIENHLKKQAEKADTFQSFLNHSVTYRYTAGRIKRSMLSAMMQLKKEEVRNLPDYDRLRVLAFNDTGRRWLHEARQKGIPVASRFADIPYAWRQIEYRSTLLYTSVLSAEERKRLLDLEIRGAHYIR